MAYTMGSGNPFDKVAAILLERANVDRVPLDRSKLHSMLLSITHHHPLIMKIRSAVFLLLAQAIS